ncbi:hypothetical protein BGZ70_009262 [Mortierella alpina]|uniref:DSBA-like thioredoxin domain-containing protein n=1 Tax=Mortierella alpina TaxID=64518 RepID=A0A9P6J1T5_MORAP|nr:hypothetical protein BGZ70_009262 [Mortierella alpina]
MTGEPTSSPFEGCGSISSGTLPVNLTAAEPASAHTTSAAANPQSIRMDIYSDTTCPWCYITKKRLEKAMHIFQSQTSNKIRFDIHWHPYQLDPQAPQLPVLRSKLLQRKFGSERAAQVQERILVAGKIEGIEFLYSDQSLYCNTMDSHRLIRFAREKMGPSWKRKSISAAAARAEATDGDEPESEETEMDDMGNLIEDLMVEELFKSHFERGECGDVPTLKECGRKVLRQIAALDELHMEESEVQQQIAEMERVLDSQEGLDEVKEEIRVAKQEIQLQGVPAIVVQNTYLLSGGQDASTFIEIFKRVV